MLDVCKHAAAWLDVPWPTAIAETTKSCYEGKTFPLARMRRSSRYRSSRSCSSLHWQERYSRGRVPRLQGDEKPGSAPDAPDGAVCGCTPCSLRCPCIQPYPSASRELPCTRVEPICGGGAGTVPQRQVVSRYCGVSLGIKDGIKDGHKRQLQFASATPHFSGVVHSLRFAFQGICYEYCMLPFGLSL